MKPFCLKVFEICRNFEETRLTCASCPFSVSWAWTCSCTSASCPSVQSEPLLLLLTLLHQAAAIIFEPWNKMHKLSVFSLWSGLVPIVSCRKCLSKWTKRTSSYAASPRWRMDPTPRTSCWSCGPSPSSSLDTRKVSTSVLLAHTLLLLLLFVLLWYSTVLFSWADSLCSCQWVTSFLLCVFEYPPKCTCSAVSLIDVLCLSLLCMSFSDSPVATPRETAAVLCLSLLCMSFSVSRVATPRETADVLCLSLLCMSFSDSCVATPRETADVLCLSLLYVFLWFPCSYSGWCHVKPLMSCASVYCVCLSLIPL